MSTAITYSSSLPKIAECLVAFITKSASTPKIPAKLPAPLKELASQAIKSGIFEVKQEAVLALPTDYKSISRLLLIGLDAKPTTEQFRRAAGVAGNRLAKLGISSAGLLAPTGLDKQALRALAEGAVLGSYRFDQYKAPEKDKKNAKLKQLTIFDASLPEAANLVKTGQLRADGICLARDLGNQPGNVLTPVKLAKEAEKIAKKYRLPIQIMDEKTLKKEKMELLLGVAQGSREPARLIVAQYRYPKAKDTLALVGKGVTFDSGGISLKPGAKMDEMKYDMCGAAAVLGAMEVIAQLKPKVNVVFVVPSVENMPGGQATKPGDIHTGCDGTTVEILNTDAEGRLILADALAWTVKKFKPAAIIDLATLTGSCLVALGKYASGLVTNSKPLQKQVIDASKRAGEGICPLPSFPEYELDLKSKYADIQNIGGRYAGAITAGLFLKRFIKETPWVHLDIAGTAWDVQNIGHIPDTGATGAGVATLTEFVLNWKPL